MFRSKYAPIRPYKTHDGILLNYRHYPTNILAPMVRITHFNSMQAQMHLYRWAMGLDFVKVVCIEDLYHYLTSLGMDSTKRAMGISVSNAVRYKPQILKGVTRDNDKARSCYSINHHLDLAYGLEWQIATWLPQMIDDVTDRESFTAELQQMLDENGKDLSHLYITRYVNEPNWREIFSTHKLTPELPMFVDKIADKSLISPPSLSPITIRTKRQFR